MLEIRVFDFSNHHILAMVATKNQEWWSKSKSSDIFTWRARARKLITYFIFLQISRLLRTINCTASYIGRYVLYTCTQKNKFLVLLQHISVVLLIYVIEYNRTIDPLLETFSIHVRLHTYWCKNMMVKVLTGHAVCLVPLNPFLISCQQLTLVLRLWRQLSSPS